MVVIVDGNEQIKRILAALEGDHAASDGSRSRAAVSALLWGLVAAAAAATTALGQKMDWRILGVAVIAFVGAVAMTSTFVGLSSRIWRISRESVAQVRTNGQTVGSLSADEISWIRIIRAGDQISSISFVAKRRRSMTINVKAHPSLASLVGPAGLVAATVLR